MADPTDLTADANADHPLEAAEQRVRMADGSEVPTPPAVTAPAATDRIRALRAQHQAELAQVQSTLFQLVERRDQLRVILLTLDKAEGEPVRPQEPVP